jgi:AcrR family transcriptional regulator
MTTSPTVTPATAPVTAPTAPDSARERLLQAGLHLFAQRGYSQTSTRELAEAAHVNVAAISYYFGDKAGLYRAVFFGPSGSPEEDVARFADPALGLPDALRGFYQGFLEPLRQSDDARLCTKLHFREILEPTGLWDEQLAHGIRPMHDALVALLQRHLGLPEADDELHALAICLTAPGVHLHVAHDITARLAPALQQGSDAIDRWSDRLVRLGVAMVEAERARRAATNEVKTS